jgi:hypothetical protein
VADDGIDAAIRGLETQLNSARSFKTATAGTLDAGTVPFLDAGISQLDDAVTNLDQVRVNLESAKALTDPKQQKELLDKAQRLFDQATDNAKLAAGSLDDAANAQSSVRGIYRGSVIDPDQKLKALSTGTDRAQKFAVDKSTSLKNARSAIDNLDSATKNADEAAKALSGAGGLNRAKEILKGTLRLGGGIGCSILSNMLGVNAYNKTIDSETEQLKKQATSLMNTPIKKDTTYRIVVLDKTTKFEEVNKDNQAMIDQMNEELKVDPNTNKSVGTTLYWQATRENPLPPYQRKLSYYDLDLDTRELHSELKNSTIPDDGTHELIRDRISSSDAQKIIKNYAVDPNTRLNNNGVYAGQEMMAAIIAASDATEKELENEAKSGSGKIKTATEKLLTLLGQKLEEQNFNTENEAKVTITPEIAKQIFEDEKKANIFYVLSNTWSLTILNKKIF